MLTFLSALPRERGNDDAASAVGDRKRFLSALPRERGNDCRSAHDVSRSEFLSALPRERGNDFDLGIAARILDVSIRAPPRTRERHEYKNASSRESVA